MEYRGQWPITFYRGFREKFAFPYVIFLAFPIQFMHGLVISPSLIKFSADKTANFRNLRFIAADSTCKHFSRQQRSTKPFKVTVSV